METGITYHAAFAEWEAATAAGLDLYRWETGGYPRDFCARVLAFHQVRQLVRLHSQDAQQAAAARHQRRK